MVRLLKRSIEALGILRVLVSSKFNLRSHRITKRCQAPDLSRNTSFIRTPGLFRIIVRLVQIGCLAPFLAFAAEEAPQSFTYQGRMMNAAGTAAVADGTYTVRFRILSESGSCLLYHEEQSVTTSNGFFSVQIGSPQAGGNRLNPGGAGATDDPQLTAEVEWHVLDARGRQ